MPILLKLRIHLLMVPYAMITTLGIAILANRSSAVIRCAVMALVMFSAYFSTLKMVYITPHAREVDWRMSVMHALQERAKSPIVLFVEGDPNLLDLLVESYGLADEVRIIANTSQLTEAQLETYFRELSPDTSVVTWQALEPGGRVQLSPNPVYEYPAFKRVPFPDSSSKHFELLRTFVRLTEQIDLQR